MRTFALGVLALSLLTAPAQASQRIYSYIPGDDATRAKIDSGLTFVFDRGLMSMRVKEILATEAHAEAQLDPADERELGERLDKLLPAGARERDLYSVEPKNQGPAMVRAFCPGSIKGWLVFSALRPRDGAVVHALGEDPQTGKARYCATLRFDFRGEWRLPNNMQPGRPQGARPDWPF